MKMSKKIAQVLAEEKGSFGVKEIAVTVAVIVVIGFAITVIEGNMDGWVSELWDLFLGKIQDLIG